MSPDIPMVIRRHPACWSFRRIGTLTRKRFPGATGRKLIQRRPAPLVQIPASSDPSFPATATAPHHETRHPRDDSIVRRIHMARRLTSGAVVLQPGVQWGIPRAGDGAVLRPV